LVDLIFLGDKTSKGDVGLNLMDHLPVLGLLVGIKLRHQLILSAKENEPKNFGVIYVKVLLDHCHREFTETLLDNPSERAIIRVLPLLLAVVTVNLISIDIMRCNILLCGVSELGHDGN
jgi:hypothetical protein